jgi:membrane protein implicated in regulation of membrane protease activity
MKPFTTIAIVIIALVAVVHVLRLILGWEIIVSGAVIPMWVSVVGFLIAGGLAVMLWRESRKGKS